jgi:hypothetical protein
VSPRDEDGAASEHPKAPTWTDRFHAVVPALRQAAGHQMRESVRWNTWIFVRTWHWIVLGMVLLWLVNWLQA